MYSRALLAAAASVPFVAAQTVTITNNCEFPVYLWNVVNSYTGTGSPDATLQPGSSTWSSSYQNKIGGGGISDKIKNNTDIFDGGELIQIEYKATGAQLFYDLSFVNGNPWSGTYMTMSTSDSSCTTLTCEEGADSCPGAYYQPDDTATMGCNGTPDLYFSMCSPGGSGSSGSSGSSSSAAPAPAPSSSSVAAAPAPSSSSSEAPPPAPTVTAPAHTWGPPTIPTQQPSNNNNGGGFLEGESGDGVPMVTYVATTIVPVTVTKHMPAATPEVGSDGVVTEDKREAHLHEHKHRGISRVMGRHQHHQ